MENKKAVFFFFIRILLAVLLMMGSGVDCGSSDDVVVGSGGGSGSSKSKSKSKANAASASASASASGSCPRKLFVFGDSYVDTGNLPKILSPSWSEPYGITFPKKPAGRFSDGRVFTDYLASFMGIKSPIPYKYRRYGQKLLPFGMNFAAGGSGVFGTTFLSDNLTMQINNLKEQIDQGVFDLQSSTALVAISGNDYVYYRDNGGTMEGLKTFTPKLIGQLKLDLESLRELGVQKVAVNNLHPIGCLPTFTRSSAYKECNKTVNEAVAYHNRLLHKAVQQLNQGASLITIINLFHGFMSVLNHQYQVTDRKNFGSILKPCCEATSTNYSCGSVDFNGTNMYTVCPRPDSAFYWDTAHPTQAGWQAVFSSLKTTTSLNDLLLHH